MKTKLFLALAAIVAFATSANADITISDAGFANVSSQSLSPTGDYLVVPGLGNAGGFILATGGPIVDSTFNDATENIGLDTLGGDLLSSDALTDNGGGSFNLLLTLESTSGDLAPGGFADGGGVALDTAGIFFGANAGGTPIDFGAATVTSAFIDGFLADGSSIFGGPVDLVPLGFDIQSGSFGVSFGAGTAGIGLGTITLDVGLTKQNAIPEPTSIAILGVMGLGLVSRRRR